jgi:hypothetical protein
MNTPKENNKENYKSIYPSFTESTASKADISVENKIPGLLDLVKTVRLVRQMLTPIRFRKDMQPRTLFIDAKRKTCIFGCQNNREFKRVMYVINNWLSNFFCCHQCSVSHSLK